MDSNIHPGNQDQPTSQQEEPAVHFRVIVVGVVQNDLGEYLICKMPKGRGVFPDQWGLPGGGIEESEMMETALRRELKEELGIEISDIKPLFFTDGQYRKSFADGTQREVYMIFLIFSCKATNNDLVLAPEFSDYAWVRQEALTSYDLNTATIATFEQMGIVSREQQSAFSKRETSN
jgi:nucleoside triphosphatase